MKIEYGITGSRSENPSFSNRSRHHWWIILFAFVTVIGVVISGILPRIQARATLRKETADLAVPTVSVVLPKQSAPAQEIVLPANVQAFADAPIYARTNGYLKRWYADIGAHVKTGQLLAEIETPEIDQQLRQARADLATAEANLNLSKLTAERYRDLLKTDSVSKQEADNAAGDYAAKQAIMQSALANVSRLEQVQSFEKIYAPFDGVITARNTDIGALIDSGSSGLTADLTLSEFPGRRFPGKLVRTANAIDQATRTLLVEILVDNPTGTLFTGAYAEVHLKLPTAVSSLLVPANSLIFRSEGLQVATVRDEHHAELKRITVGHDFGTEVEVVGGLTGNEAVIVNPPDSLVSGQTVRISQTSSPEEQQQQKGLEK